MEQLMKILLKKNKISPFSIGQLKMSEEEVKQASAQCFSKTEELFDCVAKNGFFSKCKMQIQSQISCYKNYLNSIQPLSEEFSEDLENYYKTQYSAIDAHFNNPNSNPALKTCFKPNSIVNLCDSNTL
jgi:hypothetical protein